MVVDARNVIKEFGPRVAVAGVNLQIPRGICFGLLGPNGAGKTTTLRMIYGVIRPTSGTVRVFGLDVAANPRAVRSRLGVTLQQNVLIEALSPVENLRVFGRYHLLSGRVLDQRIEDLLDFLELRSHAHVPVKQLSGGFQRRLSIAQSLVNDPELLILDEPTTGLDPAVRLALWARIRALRADGKTILLTTHYMDEAQRLCDRVAIIAAGKVLAEGPPDELITAHLAPEALECECTEEEVPNLLDGLPVAHVLRAGDRLTIYAEDVARLAEAIRSRDGGERRTLVLRPANLEDVFLALTGSSLEEGEP